MTVINPTGTFVLPMVYECINDTLWVSPENQYSQLGDKMIMYTGRVGYPMKMKKGDLLPDNRNILISYNPTGSVTTMMPYISKTTTTHYVDEYGVELYKTVENTFSQHEVTNNFSSISTTETEYANREVVGDTTITYKGKTYQGYKIECYLLNHSSMAVTADHYQKAIERIANRNIAKAERKLNDDDKGVFTTIIDEIFVPELGVVASYLTKKDGAFFSSTTLTDK